MSKWFVFYHKIIHIYSILSSKFIYCMKFDHLQQRQSYKCFSITTKPFSRNKKCSHGKPTIIPPSNVYRLSVQWMSGVV